MTTPFTYLIGWSKFNKYYYGVKYSYNCHPNDLWTTYFTSSKYVLQFRQSYGEPDIIKIRKVFDSTEKAIFWEDSVIKRAKLYSNERFLNKAYSGAIYYDKEVKKKMSDHAKKPRSEKFKKSRSESMKKQWESGVYSNRPKLSEEYKNNMSNILKEKYSKCVHHSKGTTLSETHKKNISIGMNQSEKYKKAKEEKKFSNKGSKNGMFNKTHNLSTKQKISEKAKNRQKFPCPICGTLATKQSLGRYHKNCSTTELQQMIENMKNKD
jgi:predicted RNA-binding Zn-ribbon protein involved in translation (DUF1610 family)